MVNEPDQLENTFEAMRTNVPVPHHFSSTREDFLAQVERLRLDNRVSPPPSVRRKGWRHSLFRHATQKGTDTMFTRKWSYAASFVTILALIAGVVVAQQILELFRQLEADQHAIPITFGGSEPRTIHPPQTFEEAVVLADFAVRLPASVPETYEPGDASYANGQLTFSYQCDSFRKLILQQRPMTSEEAAALKKLDVGASAIIEPIPIGDTVGQYVRGTWIIRDNLNALAATAVPGTPIPAQSIWENNSELQRLFWYDEGIFYALYNIGSSMDMGTAGECALDKDDFAAVANSLAPANLSPN